ncbi:unnamed protein product [Fraxinus pennsylvanica]|uniref:Lon protease homolog n=1 Tax=Fraxinus pennsylvanica TaxID=56036 RepID=A0AAD2DXY5_9LAMI|nr:unnamed protein product [Fraxinus pennsylvanica]
MLKVLTSTHRFQAATSFGSQLRPGPTSEDASPILRLLNSLGGTNRKSPYFYRRFFCSNSSDGSNPAETGSKVREVDGEVAESKSSSAIVPTVFRPEDYLTVIALPLPHRPLFPGFYMPIYVKDPKLLEALVESRKRQAPYAGAFLLKDEAVTEGKDEKNIYDLKGKELFNRLHEVGTLAQITSIQGDQVVLIGHRRLRISEMVSEDPLTVKVDHLKEKPHDKDDDVLKATSFEVISTLRDVLKISSLWRDHVQTYTQHIGDFNYPRLADFGAAISGANKSLCQQVLEELDVHQRLKLTLELVKKEMEISKIQESIAKAIEEKISGEQRRYLLNEQLKAIKKELGLETDDKTALSAKFRERLDPKKEKIPPHVLQVIEEELTKLQLLEASSSEFNVTRNYLDWLTALPWGEYSDENFDVIRAQNILDVDHYGLTDVKERILEFIAVGKLRGTSQDKIFTFMLIPDIECVEVTDAALLALIENYCREAGVRNLQKQIEKIYRKIALQLVRGEAHVEPMIAGVQVQPDEVKAESDRVPNETMVEGVGAESVDGSINGKDSETAAEAEIVEVDSPADQISSINQSSALEDSSEAEKIQEIKATSTEKRVLVDTSNLVDFVGKPVFHAERIYDQTPVGVVMGLAWTAMGGSTLYVETSNIEQGEGKGGLNLTGQLGDVMKESAQIAHTVARAILLEKDPDNPFFTNSKLHLHVPAGATPKDGPSAGCTMITSLLSLAMNKPVRKDLAMTGEVTLTRKILPIGGVKEKTIAARRSDVKTIIFPSANRRDFDELAPNVKEGLEVHFVDDYSQIFDLAFNYSQDTE